MRFVVWGICIVVMLVGIVGIRAAFEKAVIRPRIMELSCEEQPDGTYAFRYTVNGTYAEVTIRDKEQVAEFREYLERVGDW